MAMKNIQHVFTATLMVLAVASAAQSPNLGSSANYAILAQSTITSTGATSVKGNVGVSPAASPTITGFTLTLSSDGTYSTSPLVDGKVYAADYGVPTPATLITAVSDMQAAYNDASTRTSPDFTNHGAGNLNGVTLTQGFYKWTTPLKVGGTITVSGSSSDVFIFQTDGTLDFAGDANIVLTNGAKPQNIFWVSAGSVAMGAGSTVRGNILGKTSIIFGGGAKLVGGRALAQTAVTMIGNSVSQPI